MLVVGAAALGLAYVKAFGPLVLESYETFRPAVSDTFVVVSNLILAPIAVAGGVGLWRESRREPGRKVWALGRWVWATSSMSVAIETATTLLWLSVGNPHFYKWWLNGEMSLPYIAIKFGWTRMFVRGPHWVFLVAALGAAKWAGAIDDSRTDGREWAGRAFAVYVALAELAAMVMNGLGR